MSEEKEDSLSKGGKIPEAHSRAIEPDQQKEALNDLANAVIQVGCFGKEIDLIKGRRGGDLSNQIFVPTTDPSGKRIFQTSQENQKFLKSLPFRPFSQNIYRRVQSGSHTEEYLYPGKGEVIIRYEYAPGTDNGIVLLFISLINQTYPPDHRWNGHEDVFVLWMDAKNANRLTRIVKKHIERLDEFFKVLFSQEPAVLSTYAPTERVILGTKNGAGLHSPDVIRLDTAFTRSHRDRYRFEGEYQVILRDGKILEKETQLSFARDLPK